MKKKIIQISAIAISVVVFIIFMSYLLAYQCSADEIRIKQFYNEQKDSIDVMLFGSSTVRSAFIPTIAYEEYGFTSYDYCVNCAPLPIMQFMIEEVLNYQSPKVIVIDIHGIAYCNKDYTTTYTVHFTENINNNKLKQKINKYFNKEEKLEDKIPLYSYHSNWPNIGLCTKYRNYFEHNKNHAGFLKGYSTIGANKKFSVDPKNLTTTTETRNLNDYEQKAVNDLLDYCDTIKNQTQILFAEFPRCFSDSVNIQELVSVNTFAEIIKTKGYEFVNLTNNFNEMQIDTKTDFIDQNHFNHFGAEKFTNFFAKYLKNTYHLEVEHTQSVVDEWENCVAKTQPFYGNIKQQLSNNTTKEYTELDLYEFIAQKG